MSSMAVGTFHLTFPDWMVRGVLHPGLQLLMTVITEVGFTLVQHLFCSNLMGFMTGITSHVA